jgi:acylphosphatase
LAWLWRPGQLDPRDEEPIRVRLRVYGSVQGVYFRATMREVARYYGVKGWVRNVPDGSVEAVLEGPRKAVEEVVKWALRGPPAARVEKLVAKIEPYQGEFDDFEIRY